MWAIYEITPGPQGDERRVVVIRESKGEATIILQALELTNRSFDYYVIEEVKTKEQ